MISFKRILKYLIYLFIAGWMFLLGIMVGRGSSPVTFDTQKFQKRLEVIANEFGEKKGVRKKIDLKFYDVLDSPVPEERVPPKNKPLEIIPKRETITILGEIPIKTSKKRQTFKKEANKAKPPEQLTEKTVLKGKYTIQIAAYKEFKDAVTQMTILEKKGFSSYRIKGQKESVTWYRVRTGSFATYDEAKKMKEKLKKAKINSIIIKKE